MTTLLLDVRDVRIDADGATLVDGLTFQASGRTLAIVGDASPLFRLFTDRGDLLRGQALVLGCPAQVAVRENVLGVALSDLVLPAKWTITEYLTESARLLGVGRREAKTRAAAAIDRLELGALRKRALSVLGPFERRVLSFAQATLGSPRAIAIEMPFAGLDDSLEAPLARLIDRATEGGSRIVSFGAPASVGAAADLAQRADHAVTLRGRHLGASGSPTAVLVPSRRYTVRTARALAALAASLDARGLHVERPCAGGDAGRLVVHLPEGATTAVIVDAAVAAEAPIIELVATGLEA